MDKKIGIVTWYANLNYGGTLQAYALQKVIDSFGLDSEFIDYHPERRTILYKAQRWVKDIVMSCYKPRLYWSRKKIYGFVRDNLKISPPYNTYAELRAVAKERYSAAICGSDQIWSNIGGEINPLYYLTFIDETKRIAYAPSIGYNQVPSGIERTFGKYVNAIRFLSVRERHGAKLIKDATGRDAKVVLDPSLLLTKAQWESEIKLAGKRSQKPGYIFCYFLGRNPEYAQYVGRLSQYMGYPAIGIESKLLSLGSIKKVVADPFDFLALLNNATFVLTDSFHGVAFSINFGKQFAVFKRFEDSVPTSQNSRIYNILEKTGLERRLINTQTPTRSIVDDSIDYASVCSLLDKERRQSMSYLRNAVSSVIDGRNETDFQ